MRIKEFVRTTQESFWFFLRAIKTFRFTCRYWREIFDQMSMSSTESVSIAVSLMLSARVDVRKRLFSIE